MGEALPPWEGKIEKNSTSGLGAPRDGSSRDQLGDRQRDWGIDRCILGAFGGGVETQCSRNFLEYIRMVPVITPSTGGYRI